MSESRYYIFTMIDVLKQRRCHEPICRTMLFWIASPHRPGSRIPIDCSVEGCSPPGLGQPGRGVSHFTTCKNPNRFSKGKRRSG